MPDDIVKRTVRVVDPIGGDIEVEINLAALCLQIARIAFRSAHGKSEAKVHLKVRACCSPELLATRKAYLRLTQQKREHIETKFEYLP